MKTTKSLLIITICAIILFGSCATTYVNSARDTSKASKALTKRELGANNFIVVPQSGKIVYQTISDYFHSKNNESVVRYTYNKTLNQYHTNDWIFLISPPNNKKGAYLSSKRDFMSAKQKLIMVYVDPTNPDGTEIKVVNNYRNVPTAKETLTQILNRLPSIDDTTSPDSTPTDTDISTEEIQ